MHQIRHIKSYELLTAKYETRPADLPIFEDRAVADFRGFYAVATVHTGRVRNPLVIQTIMEILDTLKAELEGQKGK